MWTSCLRMGTWLTWIMGQKTSFNCKASIFYTIKCSQFDPDVRTWKPNLIIFNCLCSNETQENDDETNISQEILVLDFGDEKSEFLRSGSESDFNGGKILSLIILNDFIWTDFYNSELNSRSALDKTVTIIEPCPTKTSVFALAVTCALMILVYLSTVFCYFMKKWMQPHKLMA